MDTGVYFWRQVLSWEPIKYIKEQQACIQRQQVLKGRVHLTGRYDLLCSVVLPLLVSVGAGHELGRGVHALYYMAAAG